MAKGKRFKADGDSMTAVREIASGWVVAKNQKGNLVVCNYNSTVKPPKWEGLEWFEPDELDEAVAAASKRSKHVEE
jgi:hypothetical protein